MLPNTPGKGAIVGLKSTDLAKLVLRGAIGGPMVYAGLKHARSQAGTSRWLKSIGFREPDLNAKVMAASELGAGAAILSGTMTTAGCASTIGVMTVAIRTVHAPNGYSIEKEGYEFTLSLLMGAAALAIFGPGPLSGDRLLRLDDKAAGRFGALAALAAIPFAFAHLAAFWRRQQPVSPPAEASNEAGASDPTGGVEAPVTSPVH
jgi:putative oxidoreductase